MRIRIDRWFARVAGVLFCLAATSAQAQNVFACEPEWAALTRVLLPEAVIGDLDSLGEAAAAIPPDRLQVLRAAMKPPTPALAATPATRPPRPSTVVDAVNDETLAPDEPEVPDQPSERAEAPLASAPAVRAIPDEPRARSRALDEPADGVLVVEAPPDASVTVNGVERGRGVVRVLELDRFARHAVRIHCPGHVPWSGSVSLEGRPAAKIKPSLRPRAR